MANSPVSDQNHDFTDAQDWFNHGCDLYDLEQYEEAIAAFDKVIEFDSEHFEAWFNRAAVLHKLERYEEGIANYTKAIEINPNYSEAWFSRGQLLEYHLQNHTSALENYDKASELDPENPDIWANRVEVLNALGRYDEAEYSNARAVSINVKFHPSMARPQHKLPAVNEPVVVDRHTDFTKAFCDGYSFYQDFPYFGRSEVTFSTYEIGELNLTSGRIVACDPALNQAFRCPFTQHVEPGGYPVFLSVAYSEVSGDSNVACVMIRFHETEAIRWELAQIYSPDFEKCGEVYGVDTGMGCFMDLDAAVVLYELKASTPQEEADIHSAWSRHNELAVLASNRAQNHADECFYQRFFAEMENNATRPPGERWACIQVSDRTQANIVAFSSGYGDGAYASYWGYDPAGNLASLITDFSLFPSTS